MNNRISAPPYHRKRVGLNHLAFHAASQVQLQAFVEYLKKRGTSFLYEEMPNVSPAKDNTVFFEDPDRIKVELRGST